MASIFGITPNYWFYIVIAMAILVIAIVILARKEVVESIKIGFDGIKIVFKNRSKPSQIFARSDSTEFAAFFEKLAWKAKRIVLIGTGINILQHDTILIKLVERVKTRQCDLEIYLANPYSPAVEMRLIEEEIGDIEPTVGKVGLEKRLRSYVGEKKKMDNPSNNFVIKVFSHYPAFAMLILDDHYLFYPYGYALLGNQSPVSHFSRSNPDHEPMIEFLERQYENVKGASADAQLVLDAKEKRLLNADKLWPFAVYFVPEDSSALYKFGSKILGFDLRKHCPLTSPWADYVGSGAEFGFHLTIVDVLYYPCKRDRDLLRKEIEFVANDLHSFSLSFKIKERFPNETSISLVCSDESGTLESLHYEMVFRCYRQAAASNYSLESDLIGRDSSLSRGDLMIQRYHAPYILQEFKPHFTLLTDVPNEKMDEVARDVNKLFQNEVKTQQIKVKYIAVMDKALNDQHWMISEPKVQLGE